MLTADLPPAVDGAMQACWHMVSVMLVWSAFVFWKGGKPAFHFSLLWLASALVFIYVGLSQSGLSGLIVNPQWTILGLTGAVVIWDNLSAEASRSNHA